MSKQFISKSELWEKRLKNSLNEEQLAAATAPSCPVLIIAGAGTGKTHTLTHRVAYLLLQGIQAPRIMLATFTNRAAREMVSRVRQMIGAEAELVTGGTFHHIANLLLRRYSHAIGFPPNYTILDSEDSEDLINQCRSEAGINLSEKLFPSKSVLQDIFSDTANRLRTVEATVKDKFPYLIEHLEAIEQIGKKYTQRKRELAVMDYDDLLIYLLQILESNGNESRKIKESFSAILVDEYQDTNALQGKIVDILAEDHRNITVVGDDAQSIYSFRGAEFRNIITFPERYPDCLTYYLTTNYRSTPAILNFTNASIAHNIKQFKKDLKPIRADNGLVPIVLCCEDPIQQAETVAERILNLREEGILLSEIGVLYRAHWNSMELQMELAKRRIPFEVRSGLRFFERAHIKDACAFLRIVTNVRDELAWRRALPLFPGIGNRLALKIYQTALKSPSPLDALNSDSLKSSIPKRALTGLNGFIRIINSIKGEEMLCNPSESLKLILKEGYLQILQSKYPDWESREDDILQMADYAATFDSTEKFLSHLAISTSITAETTIVGDANEEDVLTLSTVHRAKGLEWRVVFLLWCTEGALPSSPSLEDADAIEEERRVFYVACTRAKEMLVLLYPQFRTHTKRWRLPPDGNILQEPSRFLKELPREVYEEFYVQEDRL